jgi:exosortase
MSKSAIWPVAVTVLFFALFWAEVIKHLIPEWSFNPQYGYGWSVPLLTVYLLWQRWTRRPPAAPPHERTVPFALIILSTLLFFPLRIIAQGNPDWRLVGWTLALSSVVTSLSFAFLTGGLPWLRHFAFPLCFFLIAVPWPVHFEQIVIQDLMRTVSAINVAFLNVAGVPALQHGNVIEIGNGFVGIEEACSGVRSFQATLMISLFLGEFYTFSIARRLLLVVAGALLAFICNLVRTGLLVWLTAVRGTSALEAWHDPAGMTILLICLFGLWLFSLLIRRQIAPALSPIQTKIDNHFSALSFASSLFLCLALWIVFAEAAVQVWYRAHRQPVANTHWQVQWPTSENTFRAMPIPAETKSLLHYDQGSAGMWKTEGRPWMMYFFRWAPGRTAGLSVKIHRPEICLPATGMTLNHDGGGRLLTINGVDLFVHSYRFDDRGEPLHVLYCYGDVRSPDGKVLGAEQEDWTAGGRMRAAFKGRPEIGAVLELAAWGYRDDAEAYEVMQKELQKFVRPE